MAAIRLNGPAGMDSWCDSSSDWMSGSAPINHESFQACSRSASPRTVFLLPRSRCRFGIPRFCSQCWSDLSPVQRPVCPSCGRPFGSPESLTHSPEHECLTCRTHPPHFDQALAAGQVPGEAPRCVDGGAGKDDCASGPDYAGAAPFHRKRLRHRGFNQALILAHGISERFSVPLLYDNLMRLRSTRPQVELSGPERRSNVQGAFGLVRPAEVRCKRILLIDDVFTTGATMNECAKVLKEAGAASVTVLTLARTVE
jgi:predicted amidophosphoribosyltransferase